MEKLSQIVAGVFQRKLFSPALYLIFTASHLGTAKTDFEFIPCRQRGRSVPEAQTSKERGDVPFAQWAVASNPQLLILACCQSPGLLLATRRATFVWVAEQCKAALFDATKELHLEFVPLVCSQGMGLLEVNVTFSRECHFPIG